jgi:hypothetical protein
MRVEEDNETLIRIHIAFESELSEATALLQDPINMKSFEWPSFGKIQYNSIAENNSSYLKSPKIGTCLDENIR